MPVWGGPFSVLPRGLRGKSEASIAPIDRTGPRYGSPALWRIDHSGQAAPRETVHGGNRLIRMMLAEKGVTPAVSPCLPLQQGC